jgi:hypothetical protein
MFNALNEQIMFTEMERRRERLQVRRSGEPKVRRRLRRAA